MALNQCSLFYKYKYPNLYVHATCFRITMYVFIRTPVILYGVSLFEAGFLEFKH